MASDAATEDDVHIIQDLWKSDNCLCLDSIQFGTGHVILLNQPCDAPHENDECELEILGRTTIREASKLCAEGDVGLDPIARPIIVLESSGQKVTGGECGADGSFGFVAVSNVEDSVLVWLAFFYTSNPFESLSVDHEVVIATNNLGGTYRFPLNAPEQVWIGGPQRPKSSPTNS